MARPEAWIRKDTELKITNFNPRKSRHGEDLLDAGDLDCTIHTDVGIIVEIEGKAAQGIIDHLWLDRKTDHPVFQEFKSDAEFPNHDVGLRVLGKDIVLKQAKLCKIKYVPSESAGFVTVHLQIQADGLTEHQLGKLCRGQQHTSTKSWWQPNQDDVEDPGEDDD